MTTEIVEKPSETTEMTWIERIIEKGVKDPNAITKLIELMNRQEDRLARSAYQTAMTQCQAEMPTVVRDKDNDHTKKKYAALETVQFAAKPIYTKHGFSLSFGEQESTVVGHIKQYVDVMHRDGHVERHFGFFPVDGLGPNGKPMMSSIQGHGSTITYGKRYLVCQVFNINIADEDRDGEPVVQYATTEQIVEINTLIEQCADAGKPVTFDRFLKWLAVDNLENLDNAGVAKAVAELRSRLAATKKARPS